MSKRLITRNNLQEFLCGNQLVLEKDMLMSPGAADYAKNQGIQVVHHSQAEAVMSITSRIVRILEQDFGITDPEQVIRVKKAVMSQLKTA